MADAGEWLGGTLPGRVYPYHEKERQVGWRFQIGDSAEAKKLPKYMPRSKCFSFVKYGDDAKAAAEAYQRQIIEDCGLELKTSTAAASTQMTVSPTSSFTSGT